MLAGPILSIADGLRLVASIAGTPGPIVVPAGMVRGAAVVMDVLGRLLPLPPMLAAESMRAGMATYLGNPAKAEHELGWTAREPETGLRETVDALRR
jgi:nucleoside-diphosphate-sugar epimerase